MISVEITRVNAIEGGGRSSSSSGEIRRWMEGCVQKICLGWTGAVFVSYNVFYPETPLNG